MLKECLDLQLKELWNSLPWDSLLSQLTASSNWMSERATGCCACARAGRNAGTQRRRRTRKRRIGPSMAAH